METIETTSEAGSRLMSNLKSMIQDAERVLESSAQQGGESFLKAKEKLAERLIDVKYAMREWEDVVVSKTKNAAICTAEYAKEHPWQAAGVIAAVGILIGVLIARR
jgi:ElaB/YqjD/DUF883 family membrane-anchored ribosome-binding protein